MIALMLKTGANNMKPIVPDKQELTDQIYDTLMRNVGMTKYHTVFPFEEIQNQYVHARNGTIYFEHDDKAYELTLKEVEREEIE